MCGAMEKLRTISYKKIPLGKSGIFLFAGMPELPA
jgi:hypothetical protein